MTRIELDNDLVKIDIMIEVLKLLTKTTHCLCVDISAESFRQLNIKELTMLFELKLALSKFTGQSDNDLKKLAYTPLLVTYQE